MTMKHLYFVFHKDDLLLERLDNGTFTVPFSEEPPIRPSQETEIMPVTLSANEKAMVYNTDSPVTENPSLEFCGLRSSFYKLPYDLYLKAGKCKELLYWNLNTRYCGRCGRPMKMSTDISKKCEHCGREIWPQLATAVIVLIRRDDNILLVHARNFRGNFFGLVAGFVETGETLEEAVHREVIEETGLKIKNVKYFGSQPWPYPCGLMVGFTADYESGDITLQQAELSAGGWFNKDNLPVIPEKLSIARKLIDAWIDGQDKPVNTLSVP